MDHYMSVVAVTMSIVCEFSQLYHYDYTNNGYPQVVIASTMQVRLMPL
jgi:hypothetical protein